MVPSEQSAKLFLSGLFSILQQMLDNAMQQNSGHQESLREIKFVLKGVEANFTEAPILDEVEEQLDTYRRKVQYILENQPELGNPEVVKRLME
ncbi:MAG: hypothetical protein WA939_12290 [Nodosilinea sp.]